MKSKGIISKGMKEYSLLKPKARGIILVSLIVFVIFAITLIICVLFSLFSSNQSNIYSYSECNDMAVRMAIGYEGYSWWQTLLIANGKWIIIMVGLSWVIHGVQMRLLA